MLTLLASLVRWSTVAVLLVGLGFVASSLVTGQGADFVDLTGRPVIEPADVGRLASQMAQIRNASPAAPEYRQPLPVTLEIVAM
jgi:hypothetical protein